MAHPLVKEDLDNINAFLKGIKDTREIINRAKLAGMDMSSQEAELETAETRLKGFKQGFFPSGRAT